jgi:hypothetical protein
MKPIVEAMGLGWASQHAKIKAHPVLSKGIQLIAIPSAGGTQRMTALPLKRLSFWLATINANKVDPTCRASVIRNLIRRHALALAELGILFTVEGIPVRRGRPGKAYYLNRPQALFVTAKSETDLATHITVEVVRKFDEYERGAKPPVPIGGELSAGEYHRIGGIVKAVTRKAIEDGLGPIEEKLRRIANDIAGLVAPRFFNGEWAAAPVGRRSQAVGGSSAQS